MEVGGAGEEVVGIEVDPGMETVEFEFNIGQEIFICQLIVQFVLVLYPIALYLLLSHQFREFPVNDAALHLIPQEKVVPLEFLQGSEAHPLLRGDGLIIIFEHFLANDVADGVDDVEKVIVELIFVLHLAYYLRVSCLTRSLDKNFGQPMELYTLVFLLQRLETVPLLYPLNFLIVVFAGGQGYFLNIYSVEDTILGSMKVDDVELYISKELADLQHLGVDGLAHRCGLAYIGLIVLPQEGHIPWRELLCCPSFCWRKELADLEFHEGQDDHISKLLDDAVTLDKHLTKVGEKVDEVKAIVLQRSGVLAWAFEIGAYFQLLFLSHEIM